MHERGAVGARTGRDAKAARQIVRYSRRVVVPDVEGDDCRALRHGLLCDVAVDLDVFDAAHPS